jgi:hypothetical protein
MSRAPRVRAPSRLRSDRRTSPLGRVAAALPTSALPVAALVSLLSAAPLAAQTGGAVTVVRQTVEPAAGTAPAVGAPGGAASAPDSGETRTRATTPCGTARLCVAGWDLRVVGVTLPDTLVGSGARVAAATVVENRGRLASPASEVRLCLNGYLQACGRPLATLPLPALASGERVRLAVPVAVADLPPTGDDRWTVAAVVDPDRATGEGDRTNNAGRSRPFALELPALQVLALEVPASVRRGARALPVTVRVRNASLVAPSPATELQLGDDARSCHYTWGNAAATRVAVPALAPRQVWAASLVVRDDHIGDTGCVDTDKNAVMVTLDPDERGRWAERHEKTAAREFTVVGKAAP